MTKEAHPGFSLMETKNSFFEIEKDLNKNKRIRTRFTVQQLEKLEGKNERIPFIISQFKIHWHIIFNSSFLSSNSLS